MVGFALSTSSLVTLKPHKMTMLNPTSQNQCHHHNSSFIAKPAFKTKSLPDIAFYNNPELLDLKIETLHSQRREINPRINKKQRSKRFRKAWLRKEIKSLFENGSLYDLSEAKSETILKRLLKANIDVPCKSHLISSAKKPSHPPPPPTGAPPNHLPQPMLKLLFSEHWRGLKNQAENKL